MLVIAHTSRCEDAMLLGSFKTRASPAVFCGTRDGNYHSSFKGPGTYGEGRECLNKHHVGMHYNC